MKKTVLIILSLLSVLTVFNVPQVKAAEPSTAFAAEIAEAANRHIVDQSVLNAIEDYHRPISRGEFASMAINCVASLYGFPDASAPFYELYFSYHNDLTGQPYNLRQYHNWPEGVEVGNPWNYMLRYEYRPFSDVQSDSEDDTRIRAAQLIGLVRGRKNGAYDPDSEISRQEAAVMLARIIHIYGSQLEERQAVAYLDADVIGEWAAPYVNIISNAGIMNGKADGKFYPLDLYTVEQSIVTFNRMYTFLQEPLAPLCGFDITVDQMYANVVPPLLSYKERLGSYAIVCTAEGEPTHPEDCLLLFAKISEKGGAMYAAIPYFAPQNFRWDAEDQKLYFEAAYDKAAYYFDAVAVKVVRCE